MLHEHHRQDLCCEPSYKPGTRGEHIGRKMQSRTHQWLAGLPHAETAGFPDGELVGQVVVGRCQLLDGLPEAGVLCTQLLALRSIGVRCCCSRTSHSGLAGGLGARVLRAGTDVTKCRCCTSQTLTSLRAACSARSCLSLTRCALWRFVCSLRIKVSTDQDKPTTRGRDSKIGLLAKRYHLTAPLPAVRVTRGSVLAARCDANTRALCHLHNRFC